MAHNSRSKKWFMLQVWRLQQVAQIITILLLAINLSLQLFGFIKWRGEALKNPYIVVPLIFLILLTVIWLVSIYWDLRLKMWRYQANVGIERNPYAKERLGAKEMAQYGLIWIPVLERLGREDKKLAEAAKVLKGWIEKEWKDDPALAKEVRELFGHIGSDRIDLLGLEEKKQQ